MDKFQHRYRIPSARWQNWDYSSNAAYFITICTNNRECYFGNIKNNKMILSHVGVLADVFWHEILNHANHVELGAFVVMTVSSIIGSYKSAVSKHAHRLGFKMLWQPRFHDHVIRDNDEYSHRLENLIGSETLIFHTFP